MRVLVVAAGTMAQAGMAALVEMVPGAEVAAAVAPRDAVAVAGELQPDVCLVDIDGGGEEALAELVARGGSPVVAVAEVEEFPAVLAAGAAGAVTPGIPQEALGGALAAAIAGVGVVFPPTALVQAPPGGARGRGGEGVQPVERLTTRELDVLRLMAEGLTNQQLARRLGISEHTAKFHVSAVLGKLGAQSRAEAVTVGYRNGLIAV